MSSIDSPKRGRPAILISANASSWLSCRTITPNLQRSYELAFGSEQNFFSMCPDNDAWKVSILAKKIAKSRPDRLVILDHLPHPNRLLHELFFIYKENSCKLPPLYVHVYGDFTLYAQEWLELGSILRHMKVTFICASDRQVRLLRQFISPPFRHAVIKCPFPVDKDVFFFDPDLRNKVRAELGASEDERLCLYSGRISHQKNVLLLVKKYLEATKKSKIKSRLLIAGQFDDIGSPFFGFFPPRGTEYQSWLNILRYLTPEEKNRIQYLGHLNSRDLIGFYNASDVGLSLSMHHDEDFGMAPIEALCTGSRMLLSDWGGYASFKDKLGYCSTISVKIPVGKPYRHEIFSSSEFRLKLEQQLRQPLVPEQRMLIAKHFQSRFSLEKIQDVIKKFHETKPPRFSGFSLKMKKYVTRTAHQRQTGIPLFPNGFQHDSYYGEIYAPYFRGDSSK